MKIGRWEELNESDEKWNAASDEDKADWFDVLGKAWRKAAVRQSDPLKFQHATAAAAEAEAAAERLRQR